MIRLGKLGALQRRNGKHPLAHVWADLSSVQSNGGERQSGYVQRAVLYKSTDVAHCPPKHPGAVHKSDLRKHKHTWELSLKWLNIQ